MEIKNDFESLFGNRKALIGMVHLRALPGTPLSVLSLKEISAIAVSEALLLQNLGYNAVILENMHDVPYLNRVVGSEIIASMTVVALQVRNAITIPIGIQILAGANQAAIAVAHAAGLDFIRAEGFVFSHVADEGWFDSDAGLLLRYRKSIGAESVRIFTDIKKKHSAHAVTADVSIAETAKAAEFFLSDGLIITGKSTGEPADVDELKAVHTSVSKPVFIGSGIDSTNLDKYLPFADGFIVGTGIKINGKWQNNIDEGKADKLCKLFKQLITN